MSLSYWPTYWPDYYWPENYWQIIASAASPKGPLFEVHGPERDDEEVLEIIQVIVASGILNW
jgi:hypothetical protein